MQRLRASIVLALVFVFSMALAFAQTSNGTIAGTVVDPSGAAIANAKVTAKSVQTGNVRTTTTNAVGGYRLESLIPGTYVITVNAEGFSQREIQNVAVAGSVITSVNANMVLGSSTVLDVEASGETLQTESGEVSHTISEADVHELPIAGLNPYALATTLPGVSTVTGIGDFTNGTSYAVNGTRPRANNFLIEGQDNNDAGLHGQALQPENLDAIKEVVVLTNSYSAEFGHGGGSVANLIYKSGSNQFHGSVWDLHMNSALDATDKADNLADTEKTNYRENVFGFTFGGPVKKDKVFFFTSYQWDKYRASATGGTLTVPTAAGYAALQALNAATPNPRVAAMLSAYSGVRGNSDPTKPGYANLDMGSGRGTLEVGRVQRTGIGTQSDSPEFDAKGDWLITKNDTLTLRYVRTRYTSPYDFGNFPSQLPGFDNMQDGTAHNGGLSYTHIFSPTLLNEFRASYGRIGFTFAPRPDQINRPDGLGTAPAVSITGLTGWGGSTIVPQGRFHNTYQLQDSVSWTVGKHYIKAGADIANIRVVDQIPYNFYGTISYLQSTSTPASALANYIDDFSGRNGSIAKTFGSPTVRPQMWSQNYFFQDTWKVKSNLSVDLGARYEYNGAAGNSLQYPAMDLSDPYPACFGATFTCAPIKQQPDGSNIGPRVGFAYTPRVLPSIFGDNKTVIRGGFGVFYDGIFTNIVDNTQAASPNSIGGSVTGSSSGRGTANWSTKVATLAPIYSPRTTQTTMVAHLLSPETLQWNFSVQRELPWSFTATLGYIGTRGEHLYGQDRLNPLDPNTGTFINPARAAIIVRDNTGDSIYHGLQAELNRKFSKGLLFRASYTYSKMMDDVAEVFTSGNFSTYPMIQLENGVSRKQVDWGLSPYDHRQRLVLSYVYEVPNLHHTDNTLVKAVSYLTNNWQLAGTTAFQSGNPANIQVGFDANGDGITNDRPSLGNPNAPINTYGWAPGWDSTASAGQVCKGPEWWVGPCMPVSADSVHWIVTDPGTNGNVRRDAYIVPGRQDWTFSLTRTVKIKERQEFEFRTEMFNPFNHGNTGTPNATLITGLLPTSGLGAGVSTFLDAPSTVSGNRSIRFLLKYSF